MFAHFRFSVQRRWVRASRRGKRNEKNVPSGQTGRAVSLTRTGLQGARARALRPQADATRPERPRILFEDVAAGEVTVLVEVIVERGVDGGEFLQGPDVSEFCRGTLSSLERLT
jgi:hypothetical protein